MRIESCHKCYFFEHGDSTCRFSPPVRLPRRFDTKATAGNRIRDEELTWGWPKVNPEDWCGEWK